MVLGKATWIEGLEFAGWDSAGNGIVMDAAQSAGGSGAGLRPIELPLVALCGCTGMDVMSILKKMQEPVRGLEVSARADRAEDHPKVYKGIEVEYRFRGKGLSRQKLERAVELSAEKYCAVSAMLERTTDIRYTITVIEE